MPDYQAGLKELQKTLDLLDQFKQINYDDLWASWKKAKNIVTTEGEKQTNSKTGEVYSKRESELVTIPGLTKTFVNFTRDVAAVNKAVPELKKNLEAAMGEIDRKIRQSKAGQ